MSNCESPFVPAHRELGARIGEFSGCLLPEGFTDFDSEFRAARESVVLIDTSWHLTAAFTGRDRAKYLHNVSSANVKDLAAGTGLLGVLLSPQGRILAELELYGLQESILVRSHASLRTETLGTMRKYILGSQVKLEDLTDSVASFAIEGPQAADLVREFVGRPCDSIRPMSIAATEILGTVCYAIRRAYFGQPGVELMVPIESARKLWDAALIAVRQAGGRPIGMTALNALRLEAAIPWFPVDFNDSAIPHEASIENSHISYNKGCYTGQEIVERVRSQGRVNRKRVVLKFSSAQPPLPGTKLRRDGRDVGEVTSSAYSPTERTAIGMAYLRREHNSPGSVVEYDGGTAEVSA